MSDGQADALRLDEAARVLEARIRSEAALRESEERYRQLVHALPGAVYTCDAQGFVTLYNQAAVELWGREPEIGKDKWCGSWQIHRPDGGPLPLEACPMAVTLRERRAVRNQPLVILRPDGTRREVLPHPEPLHDSAGNLIGAVNMIIDITDMKRAENALRESEGRFRHMADSAPVLVWIAGTDKKCIWFNRAWLEFTGRTLAQEMGDGWAEGVHPDDLDRCLEIYGSSFDARQEFRMEYRRRRHDSEYRWLLDHGVPFFGGDGQFMGYIGSCVDITDQVIGRQTLERQQALLEDAVMARTRELEESNEQLRLAERMSALGTLSAGLGHDMGNLLVPLRIRLESLSRAELAPELREAVEAICVSADYLQRLASGLRMLAVDPGAAKLGETTHVSTWWDEVSALLKNALPAGIALESRFAPEECWIDISRPALTQIVFNLVQNAGDAMRNRQGKVTVWTEASGESVRLGITDDGPGMSPEVRARCMEPFFTTKKRSISTGLGLALVYRLAHDAGGSIDVQSEVGKGTTFVLSISRSASRGPAGRSGNGRLAAVGVKDPRLSAFIAAELRSLHFDVSTDIGASPAPDVLVLDDADSLSEEHRKARIVLLADAPRGGNGVNGVNGVMGLEPSHLIALGPKPAPAVIREALKRAAAG